MNIDIICVGKIKEPYFEDACREYLKRLSRYARVSVIEVKDEKTPDKQALRLCEKVKEMEAGRVLKHLKDDAFLICLEINAGEMSSEAFAAKLGELSSIGVSCIQFVIGGSLGLHDMVIGRADMHLSFSLMTFPHRLMRVILLEQIYRAFRIINNEPYHK